MTQARLRHLPEPKIEETVLAPVQDAPSLKSVRTAFTSRQLRLTGVAPWSLALTVSMSLTSQFRHSHRRLSEGVFLDGKYVQISAEGTNTGLTFSPDSKHVFWIHQYGDRPLRLFVDGKPLADFYAAGNSLSSLPRWLDFEPDATLSFLAQDDNSLKRITITITLSPETSLATMFGGGTPVASRAN